MIAPLKVQPRLRVLLIFIAIIFALYALLFWAIVPAHAQFTPPAASATATAPIVVTPSPSNGKNFNVSCPTCGTSSGSVTSVSVATANGVAGTVATPNTTPVITLRVPGCTGLCKANGTTLSTATPGTDYQQPASTLAGYGIASPLPVAQGGTALASLAGLMALQAANNVAITGGAIGGIPNPVTNLDVVNLQYLQTYVDEFRANLTSVVATAAILPNAPAYLNGTAGLGATLTATTNGALVIDGSTVTGLPQVLVKNEASTLTNGVYVVTNAGSAGTKWSMVRAVNFNSPNNILAAPAVCASAGTVNNHSCWLSVSGAPTVGTDPITFDRLSFPPSTVVTQSSIATPPPPCVTWDSTLAVTASTTTWILGGAGTISQVRSRVAGGGSFGVAVQINGTPVTGCSAISVSGTSTASNTCTAANVYADGDQISVVVSSPSGTINTAAVCPSLSFTPQ